MEKMVPGVEKHGAEVPRPTHRRVPDCQPQSCERQIKGARCDAEALRFRCSKEADAQSYRAPQQMHQVVVFVANAARGDQDAHHHKDSAEEAACHPGAVRDAPRTAKVLHCSCQSGDICQHERADLQYGADEDAGGEVADLIGMVQPQHRLR
jgi:hypothetical protein